MLLLPLLLTLSACASKELTPHWGGKVYVLKPQKKAIVRDQEPKEEIPYDQADGAICFMPDDFDTFIKAWINYCEQGSKPL